MARVGGAGSLIALLLLSGPGSISRGPISTLAASASVESTREGFHSMEEVLAAFPLEEANASALDAERLASVLGVDLAPKGVEGRHHPAAEDLYPFERIRLDLKPWLRKELELESSGIDPLPDSIARFLAERARALEEMRDGLLRGEPPFWEVRVDLLDKAPTPNLLGHLDLQSLLLVEALAHSRAGETTIALGTLEASWRLNQGLRDRPSTIEQLIAMVIFRWQVGALRHIESAPPSWRSRLTEYDLRETLFRALRLEPFLWTHEDDPLGFTRNQPGGLDGLAQRALLVVTKPYFNLCAAEAADRWMDWLSRIERMGPTCDHNLFAPENTDLRAAPWWNAPGDAFGSDLPGVIERFSSLHLDIEMTGKILALREARRESAGQWPDRIAGLDKSSACPDERWVYARDDRGGMTLSLSRAVHWPHQVGTILPTRFVSPPPAPSRSNRSSGRRAGG